ncbi:MAG TPA: prepilin-type N-terminal cleavage/methylation domain-containing protein [Candidatus Rifleibacterium sp.]|nr:prepilin-type N-terminal cleavage/methylation domain-containing protein [Candidatus Rifleibacterium sp.]HPT46347.1 prepilin-type N-terminal cleavage/methylation domain-containing protein [Candidatus Rifleibacterium sp.]
MKIICHNSKAPVRRKAAGFTLVEALVAVAISTLILMFAYRVFFSQTEMVTRSIEFLHVNEGFRKVVTFMGDDIRESTTILKPIPIFSDRVASMATIPGVILHLQSSELDPQIAFNSQLGGQVAVRRQVIYELEKIPNPESQTVPRYRLIRTATIEEKPGQQSTQRQVLVENIRDMVIYRTVRKPFKPANISSSGDSLLLAQPLSQSGTGNNLVHVRMILERTRKETETGQVYSIAMNTSFYKRGKEIFKNP